MNRIIKLININNNWYSNFLLIILVNMMIMITCNNVNSLPSSSLFNGIQIDKNNNKIQKNYCKRDLCKIWNGTDFNFYHHIGCNNNNLTFSKFCPNDVKYVEMTKRRIKLILDLHNIARNKIALGNIKNYNSANNMPVIKWDNELQYLASLNVRTCKFAHDECRNTEKFPYSGQNIGISWQNPPFHSNSKRIKLIIGLWFNEFKDANISFINSFEEHPEGKKIGHFTLMVSDRVKRVGCSAVRYSNANKKGLTFLMACNYDFNSIYTEQIYNIGLPASNCSSSFRSNIYPGLCDWSDDDDETDHDVSEESSELFNDVPLELLDQ